MLLRYLVLVREDGAQALMSSDQVHERSIQSAYVKVSRQSKGQRDVVCSAGSFQPVQEPQPLLCERQRNLIRARHCLQGGASLSSIAQYGFKLRDRWGLEQGADGQFDAQAGADAADQFGGQQRVATQVKEVVIDADL
ncbi:hypothetical protein D3C71_1378000 [compost metagenome]